MGSVHCAHENTEFVEKIDEYKTTLFRYEIWQIKCNDCGNTFRKEFQMGRITQVNWSGSIVSKDDCDHEHFRTDETKEVRESTGSTGGFWGDLLFYREWLSRPATCIRCGFQFYVTASFRTEMKDMKAVRIVTSKWKPWMIEKVVSSRVVDEKKLVHYQKDESKN